MATVKEILGHQEIDMTLRYAYLAPVHKREAMEILGSRMDTFWRPEDSIEEAKIEALKIYWKIKGFLKTARYPSG